MPAANRDADTSPRRLSDFNNAGCSAQPKVSASSVYVLAKAAERNDSNAHTDVTRLEELGLIERTEDDLVSVPYESVEISLALAQEAGGLQRLKLCTRCVTVATRDYQELQVHRHPSTF